MNFNNFTIKSQEVIQKAVELTRSNGQQQIEPLHLLKALIGEAENIVNFVFQKLGANLGAVISGLDKDIAALPKVSGADVFLSRESNDALQKSVDYSKSMGDECIG
jgi:ATP-dependent Clp protease ATP-binding subunit ClpB